MRFGLALPQYGFSLDGAPVGFEVAADWARRAERLGFDSVWLSDHFFYSFARYGGDPAPISALEPMTTLAGLAAVTSRVRLGTLVLCAAFRDPVTLARMVHTIDAISHGRLDLGIGAGWLQQEFDAFGFESGGVGERFSVLEETLAALSAPPNQASVPIWVGGKGGPRLLRLAARYAAGWNTVWRVDPAAHAARIDAARQACREVGRDPATFRLSVGLYTVVGQDEDSAREAFERARAAFPGGAMAGETWESWCADTLSGSPQQAIDRVREFEALGVEEIVVSTGVLPFSIHSPQIVEMVADQVIAPLRLGATGAIGAERPSQEP
jgi:alkanesulfonate monooxygenase SsuD/methylene tetrahydromethanopterin reductase-like flavin-dependent oxidoreductase (luciferase family)